MFYKIELGISIYHSFICHKILCFLYLGLSFMAISESNEVMGVILNDKSCRDTIKKYDVDESSDESSKFNNIMVLLDKIQKEVDVYEKYPNVDRIMHIKIISVNDAYREQGICKSFVTKTKYKNFICE